MGEDDREDSSLVARLTPAETAQRLTSWLLITRRGRWPPDATESHRCVSFQTVSHRESRVSPHSFLTVRRLCFTFSHFRICRYCRFSQNNLHLSSPNSVYENPVGPRTMDMSPSPSTSCPAVQADVLGLPFLCGVTT